MGKKNKKNIITSTKQPHGKGRLMRGVVVERDKYSPSNKKHKPTSKLTSKSKYQLNSLSTSALKALRGDSSSASPHPPPSSETSRLIRNSLGNRTYAQPADREVRCQEKGRRRCNPNHAVTLTIPPPPPLSCSPPSLPPTTPSSPLYPPPPPQYPP